MLTIPHTINPANPLVLALHGHEEPTWGIPATTNFEKQSWMHDLAQAGNIVYAPITMEHNLPAELLQSHDYMLIWVKELSFAIDQVIKDITAEIPHNGCIITGLSGGGLLASFVMAFRDDIKAGIFTGANKTLDFYRKEHRFINHPNCWDVKELQSYLPVWALLAPRPIMLQDGFHDPFYPAIKGHGPTAEYSGRTRGILTEEFAGMPLILRHFWQADTTQQAPLPCIHIHNGAHEFISDIALRFAEGERNFCQ